MKYKNFVFLALILTGCGSGSTPGNEQQEVLISEDFKAMEVSAEDLVTWDFYGMGQLNIVNKQAQVSESEGSQGVLLVSPGKFGNDLVVSYDVMTLRPATVLVNLISLSGDDQGGLDLEDDFNAGLKFLRDSLNFYMLAFHNAPHNRFPFINRYPVKSGNPLVEAEKSYMLPGIYYHIDAGREKDRIWLAVNGKKIIEALDPEPLGDGHFSFRIRGTGNEIASCLIKNVKIYSK